MPKTTNKLNKTALKRACFQAADSVLWVKGPKPIEPIQELAKRFFEIAVDYEDYLIRLNRDPNIVTRAVRYLADVHAIPPMGEGTKWFFDMLHVLIELTCPNRIGAQMHEKFYQDIEKGIQTSRSEYTRVPRR